MAKAGGKNNAGVQNRAIYSRVSFLQQATVFLSQQSHPRSQAPGQQLKVPSSPALEGISRRLATDLRSVSLKTRIRLSPAVKRTICKYCDSVLIDGSTCTTSIENRSKGGRKPWADVMVRRCHACKKERRYPIDAKRTKRKTERGVKGEVEAAGDAMDVDVPPAGGKGKGQKQQGQKQQGQKQQGQKQQGQKQQGQKQQGQKQKQKQHQGQVEVEIRDQKG